MAESNTIDTVQTVLVADASNDQPTDTSNNALAGMSDSAHIDTSDTQPTVKPGPCGQCGIDPNYYDRQIRFLQGRIESLEIKNLTLSSECNRLHAELRESEFRARSSVSAPSFPILPSEILQEIFGYATQLEGDLVSPHYRIGTPDRPYHAWVVSSHTRRAIPLVCRNWHNIGMEYLFQHIVIFNKLQLTKVVKLLFRSPTQAQLACRNWIRGIEFILPPTEDELGTQELVKIACTVIRNIPHGRLRAFGIEDGHCEGLRASSWDVSRIVMDGLQHSEGSLELLHLPCLEAERSSPGSLSHECQARGVDLAAMNFSKLQTLSMGGHQGSCLSWCHNKMTSMFRPNVTTLRTLYLTWTTASWLLLSTGWHDQTFPFAAVNLTTVHIVGAEAPLKDMDNFLIAAPQLRRLLITAYTGYSDAPMALNQNVISHEKLQEVTLNMPFASSYTAIFDLYPLFLKVQSGNFPGLGRVILRGPYPEVYLGYGETCSGLVLSTWKDAIKTCLGRGVDFIDEQDVSLYLWHARFEIPTTSEIEASDTDTSGEGQSQETDSSEFDGGSVGDEVISDDSEDSPYRYVPQRDVGYNTDSDGSST